MNEILQNCEVKKSCSAAIRAYNQEKRQAVKEIEITELIPMVHKIAHNIIAYMNPPVSYDDLVSSGMVGLVKAAQDFSPNQNASFKTYAYIRIKGTILDEVRSCCPLPTNVSKQVRGAVESSRAFEHANGREPTEQELAANLGIDIEKLRDIHSSARMLSFTSLDDNSDTNTALANIIAAAKDLGPTDEIEKRELTEQLAKAIESLPEKQRRTIVLYYQQRLTMKQIGEVFNITEARVSQLHAEAIFNLSVKLRNME